MKRIMQLTLTTCLFNVSVYAGTNALIEVKLFKNWVIDGEVNFGNLSIKNTGIAPLLLAKNSVDFEGGQLDTRSLDYKYNEDDKRMQQMQYEEIILDGDGFFSLFPGETHIYDGRKFYLRQRTSFSEEMRFTVSVYLGKGVWLDSEPVTYNGVVLDSEERLTKISNNKLLRQGKNLDDVWDLVAVAYKNERWLYKKSPRANLCFPVCPLSLTNKIRVEPHNDEALFKI
jgi:hypothetical protein